MDRKNPGIYGTVRVENTKNVPNHQPNRAPPHTLLDESILPLLLPSSAGWPVSWYFKVGGGSSWCWWAGFTRRTEFLPRGLRPRDQERNGALAASVAAMPALSNADALGRRPDRPEMMKTTGKVCESRRVMPGSTRAQCWMKGDTGPARPANWAKVDAIDGARWPNHDNHYVVRSGFKSPSTNGVPNASTTPRYSSSKTWLHGWGCNMKIVERLVSDQGVITHPGLPSPYHCDASKVHTNLLVEPCGAGRLWGRSMWAEVIQILDAKPFIPQTVWGLQGCEL